MAPITGSIEISRPPEDVFAYLDELEKHGEWQDAIKEVRVESDGPVGVGTRAVEKRQVPGGVREFTYEITEHDPPRRSSFRVLNGPVRPTGTITVAPAGEGRSRVTFEIQFEGHGLGKVLAPLAGRDAQKHIPRNLQRLKERLESS